MKSPPLYIQELPTSCVATCVRMVLGAYHFALSEVEIRSRCNYSPLGMRLNQVASGLTALPFCINYHLDWNLYDLRDALRGNHLPIVGVDLRYITGVFSHHAVVVVEIQSHAVIINDPLDGKQKTLSLQTFQCAWESAAKEVVIIEPDIASFMEYCRRLSVHELDVHKRADGVIVLEGELDEQNASTFEQALFNLATGRDAEIHIEMSGFEVLDGVGVATAINALRELLARVEKLKLIHAPQLLCHNLYRVGLLAADGKIELLAMREEEPYG